MPMFPISDPAREDDIRTRRRRAGLLLAGIVVVPWMMFHRDDHHAQHAVPAIDEDAAGDDAERSLSSGVLADIPLLGRLRWSITGDALPVPAAGAPTRSFDASRLTVDLSCANSLTLLPKHDLGDEVIVSVRSDQRSALQTLTTKDGVLEQQEECDGDRKADFILQSAPGKALTIVREGHIDIRGGRFNGTVTLEGSGSGSVFLDGVGNLADNEQAGGDVTIAEVNGNVGARLLGSGELKVLAGTVAHLSVESRGSGDISMGQTMLSDTSIILDGSGSFTAGRVVGRIDARSFASGDVTIASISADHAHLQGEASGDIVIRSGRIDTLTASRRGSGDLDVRAVIGGGTVVHDGSGDVTLPHVSGHLDRAGRQNPNDDDG